MRNFKNLLVWNKSYLLTLEIYKITKSFPKEELYSLTSQLRRSSHSISTNISEGCGRNTKRDLVRFLDMAMGSACETENSLLLSKDLHYIDEAQYNNLNFNLEEVKKMLASYIVKTKQNSDF
jgi:four helix bundle protein